MISPSRSPSATASAATVTVVVAVVSSAPSDATHASTYVPASANVARVVAVFSGSNHTPPGPDTRVHLTRKAPGPPSPSETVATRFSCCGSVTAAVAGIVTAGATLPDCGAIRVTVTSSNVERSRPLTVARNV